MKCVSHAHAYLYIHHKSKQARITKIEEIEIDLYYNSKEIIHR